MGKIRNRLSKNIKDVIDQSGISRKILAEKLNVSQVSVSNWITGKNSPDLETLITFCEMFNVSLDEIYSEMPITLHGDHDKERLIEYYDKLNIVGRMKLIDLADDLIRSGKYVSYEKNEELSDEPSLS